MKIQASTLPQCRYPGESIVSFVPSTGTVSIKPIELWKIKLERSLSSRSVPIRLFDLTEKEAYKPISGYGIIGNMRTAALIGYDGSVDWCCLPRFDSPSVFAAILDRRKGGRWAISPSRDARSTQRYLGDTNILLTEFFGKGWKVNVTDFMPCSAETEAWSATPEIHRVLECAKGKVRMTMMLQPRFDYGMIIPKIELYGKGLTMKNSNDEMVLSSSVGVNLENSGTACSQFTIEEGEREHFVLSYGEYEPRKIEEYQSDEKLHRTEAFWRQWVSSLRYHGYWGKQVVRSALVLKLLVYSHSGAILAAPTTSLPEAVGGDRNWDYRYSWIRDSANSLWAFHILGDRSAAERYLRWLMDHNPALDLDLRLMYSIDGHTEIDERILKHLEGYKGSKPVRVGNAAVHQLQLDTYGYMLDALYFSSKHGSTVSGEMYYRFVKPLAKYVCDNWKRRGNGIWEIRKRREHFVYTKAWCYAGLDRAVKIAKANGHGRDVGKWLGTMREIRREVLTKGWNGRKRSFVMHYGSSQIDSANLILPLIGFMPARDERMLSTIDVIRRELGSGPLLRRYKVDDGLRGEEGAFLLCSFWLVAALAKAGKSDEAKQIFTKLLSYSNHLGLYAEEVDMKTGEALGNFPQAFSHMGLIMAANELELAIARKRPVG